MFISLHKTKTIRVASLATSVSRYRSLLLSSQIGGRESSLPESSDSNDQNKRNYTSTLGNTVHTLWVLPVHESSLHNCIHRSHFSRYGLKLCPDAIVLRQFKQETCKIDAVTPNALICWDFRSTICQSSYNIYLLLTWPWLVLDDLFGWALFSSNTFKKICRLQSDRVQLAVSGNVEVHLRGWWSVSAFPSSHQGGSCCAVGATNHTHSIAWSEDEKTAAWSEKKDSRLTAPYTPLSNNFCKYLQQSASEIYWWHGFSKSNHAKEVIQVNKPF